MPTFAGALRQRLCGARSAWRSTYVVWAAAGAAGAACSLVTDFGPPRTLATDAGGQTAAAIRGAPSALAVGPKQACAILSDPSGGSTLQTVRCWGSNGFGELGSDPAATPLSATPLLVPDLSSTRGQLSALALAPGYSCALSDMYFYCWGAPPLETRVRPQPETGSATYQPTTMFIDGVPLSPVTSVSVGAGGGCATVMNSLACWGAFRPASGGDAGAGSSGGSSASGSSGAPVILGDSFTQVAVGRAHACAVVTNPMGVQDVECWGANEHGQSGALSPTKVTTPSAVGLARVPGVTGILEVAAGNDASCARVKTTASEGVVYCWGANDHGQLGRADAGDPTFAPTLVPLPGTATAVAVGDAHSCAAVDLAAYCWGDNSAGQLGTGMVGGAPSAAPLRVSFGNSGMSNVQRVAAGGRTTCALRIGSPDVWCWGANDFGQAGQAASNGPDAGPALVPRPAAVAW